MRPCHVSDDLLFDFAEGTDVGTITAYEEQVLIDDHVATCDDCQGFLAEVWDGGLGKDLAEPVHRIIEMERFILDTAQLGGGILAEFLRALRTYGFDSGED
jgi:hypothetical protein